MKENLRGQERENEEARGLIDRQPDNLCEFHVLLEVARGFGLVGPAKTFEMSGSLIYQANDMMSAALLEKPGARAGESNTLEEHL